MSKKILPYLLFSLLLAAVLPASGAAAAAVEQPVDSSSSSENQTLCLSAAESYDESSEGSYGGYLTPPYKAEYQTRTEKSGSKSTLNGAANVGYYSGQLPAYFVTKGTGVKNQNSLGSCWSFAAIGMMESAILLNSDLSSIDLSEMHMVLSLSHHTDYIVNPYSGVVSYAKLMGATNNAYYWSGGAGGTEYMSSAYLTRATVNGPVSESALPYPSYADNSTVSGNNYRLSQLQEASESRVDYYPTQILFLGDNVGFGITDNGKTQLNNDLLAQYVLDTKDLIYSFGAASCAIYYTTGNYCSFSYSGSSSIKPSRCFYNDPEIYSIRQNYNTYYINRTNHEVMIIGWDDNFSVKINGTVHNGAFLVKNSNSGGEYFWMPYDCYYTDVTVAPAVIARSELGDVMYETDTSMITGSRYYSASATHLYLVRQYSTDSPLEKITAVTLHTVNGTQYYRLFYTDDDSITDNTQWTELAYQSEGMIGSETENGHLISDSGYVTCLIDEQDQPTVSGDFYVAMLVYAPDGSVSYSIADREDNYTDYAGISFAAGYGGKPTMSQLNGIIDSSHQAENFVCKVHTETLGGCSTIAPVVLNPTATLSGKKATFTLAEPWSSETVNLPVYSSSEEGRPDPLVTAQLSGTTLTVTVSGSYYNYAQQFYVGFQSGSAAETRIPLTCVTSYTPTGSWFVNYPISERTLVTNSDSSDRVLIAARYKGSKMLSYTKYTLKKGSMSGFDYSAENNDGGELRLFVLDPNSYVPIADSWSSR